MNARELFEAWAPPECVWSPWAKPVLFAHMERERLVAPDHPLHADPDVSWAPPAGNTAIVVDLPGEAGVHMGAALAGRGYRPVPLYNTTPGPPPVVLDVRPIMWALHATVEKVLNAPLAPNAPPAFLLDTLRLRRERRTEGAYDNRWGVFQQDFPSGTFMASQRISEVLLLSPHGGVGVDIGRVLSVWNKQGLQMKARSSMGTSSIEPLTPRKVLSWRLAGLFAMMALGLRRNSTGGFGSRIPVHSSGSSYGGGYRGGFG